MTILLYEFHIFIWISPQIQKIYSSFLEIFDNYLCIFECLSIKKKNSKFKSEIWFKNLGEHYKTSVSVLSNKTSKIWKKKKTLVMHQKRPTHKTSTRWLLRSQHFLCSKITLIFYGFVYWDRIKLYPRFSDQSLHTWETLHCNHSSTSVHYLKLIPSQLWHQGIDKRYNDTSYDQSLYSLSSS